MSDTYLFALTDGGSGTVAPELGVTRHLVERGHRVTILGEDSMAAAGTGATFLRWEHGLNRPDHRPEHAPYREWELTSPPAQVREMVTHLVSGPAGFLGTPAGIC